MSERDPFQNLRDLIDEPVAPRAEFAGELRSRLMREMSASEHSREEQAPLMDAVIAPRPPVAVPTESVRRIRPMVILELAAVAVIILGLVAALNRGWFQNDPDPATAVPAAMVQDDETPTPAPQTEQTPIFEMANVPTVVPDSAIPTEVPVDQVPTVSPDGSFEPTAVPPGNIPNTVWAVPMTEGEISDFGGILVDDDTVYRLLATLSFVGVQAIDAETGTVTWQQTHRWAGHLFTIEDDVLYFDGGGNTLTAVDSNSGTELWRASISGSPMAITEDDGRIFVQLNNEMVTALNAETGEELWVAQGSVPQNASGGSASDSGSPLIAVEGNVVAAISTTGVLSGFDVLTGEEMWAHDGFEAATSSILAENESFIVIDGVGIWVDGAETDVVGVVEAGSVVAGGVGAVDCVGLFQGSVDVPGTPTASGSDPVSDSFIIQAIDPMTGDVLWEEQTVPGGAASVFQGTVNAPIDSTCAIELATGNVVTVATESELDDHLIIGNVRGGVFVADDSDDELVSLSAVIEGLDGSTEAMLIAAVANDDAAYLQFADGTLVKVATGQSVDSGDNGSTESQPVDD